MVMPRIEEMYAFIVADTGPEDEGLAAMKLRGDWLPLVGADMERVESRKPIAQSIARETGQKITIARFTQRTDVETIEP
jgi:hypothetical protein